MEMLQTISLFIFGFALVGFMGWGLADRLLPRDLRACTPVVAPMVGFLAFCLVTVTVSGTFGLTVGTAVIVAASVLAISSIAAWAEARKEAVPRRETWRDLAIMTAVMLALGFWSVLYQGSSLYLGTVNPDYSQSLTFLDTLIRLKLPFFADYKSIPGVNIEPFITAFPEQLQARFAGVTFAYLVTLLTHAGNREALVTMIGTCLLCLPPAVYFFSMAIFGSSRRMALLAASLVSISGPIAMSLVHALIGQNSAIASVPLGLALGYLAALRKDARLWILFTLMLSGLVFVYVMMGPFIVAPVGVFVLYRIAREGGGYMRGLLKSLVAALALVVLLNIGMAGTVAQFFRDLATLVGGIYQSHIYSEYLTERVIVYGMGISSYPLTNSFLFRSLGPDSLYLLEFTGLAALVLFLYFLVRWGRQAPRDAAVFVAAALAVYLAVAFHYTFANPYGYSAFKMVSWLNCFVPAVMAFGLVRSWHMSRSGGAIARRVGAALALAATLFAYVGFNAVASIDYGVKSFGRDREAGLINSYGVGNNPDWAQITAALRKYTPDGSVIAMGFSDLVANNWGAYYAYLAGRSVSFSSHGLYPDDEAFLPDLKTGIARDVKGRYFKDSRPFYKGGRADYYLLPGRKDLNQEIVEPTVVGKAVWENDTVRLVKASDVHDLLITGRGFYRIEYSERDRLPWWYPDRFRWSSEGGEILQFNPAHPGEAYRLSLVAIVGYGVAQDVRTLEFYLDGRKFDEQEVYTSGRIVSAPYYPHPGMNKLTVHIKERTEQMHDRRLSLWNPSIPSEWRLLNVAFAQFRVLHDAPAPPAARALDWKAALDRAYSFNGFNIDGWVRNQAQITLGVPDDASSMKVTLDVPGTPEFHFPYAVEFRVNGTTHMRRIEKPGTATVDLPVAAQGGKVTLEIAPASFKYTPAAVAGRNLIQSVHLDRVAFGDADGPATKGQ
jgi:hypothetical protein